MRPMFSYLSSELVKLFLGQTKHDENKLKNVLLATPIPLM